MSLQQAQRRTVLIITTVTVLGTVVFLHKDSIASSTTKAAPQQPAIAQSPPGAKEPEVAQAPKVEQPVDITQPTRKQLASVFAIRIGGSAGSGFLVAEKEDKKIVATNKHVVSDRQGNPQVGAAAILRNFVHNVPCNGVVFYASQETDIAFIEVNASCATNEPLKLELQPPPVGTKVVATGNPHNRGLYITQGIVVELDAKVATKAARGTPGIAFNAKINPGNSGGTLTNADGALVAIVTAMNTKDKVGLGLYAKTVKEELQKAGVN